MPTRLAYSIALSVRPLKSIRHRLTNRNSSACGSLFGRIGDYLLFINGLRHYTTKKNTCQAFFYHPFVVDCKHVL